MNKMLTNLGVQTKSIWDVFGIYTQSVWSDWRKEERNDKHACNLHIRVQEKKIINNFFLLPAKFLQVLLKVWMNKYF